MKIFLTILAVIIFAFSNCKAQEVEVIKYPTLLSMIEEDKSEDLVIYNFWATWCAPCVKEMPYFEEVNKENNVKVKFISLDDVEKLNDRVIPFLTKKDIQSSVYLLDEVDYNAFIDKVDKRWSGAIPATLIVKTKSGDHLFYEKEFHEGELEKIVQNLK